jgi:hypothetical protein
MDQGVVVFPPRNEPNAFYQDLQGVYRDYLRRGQTAPSYVDPEGANVWLTEYFRFYLNGCSHQEAMARTLAEIESGATQPTCGKENLVFPPRNLPYEFQLRLEDTYRTMLNRSQSLYYVDSEGTNVWIAEYLRYRVAGACNHTEAESKVFAQIKGGGVQSTCTTWKVSGTGDTVFDMPTYISRVKITGDYTRYSSNFIVYIGGRLIVNELVGTGWGLPHFEGTYLTSGGVVQIKSSSGVAWTFTEVKY